LVSISIPIAIRMLFLPFLLVPHGEGEVVFGEAGRGLLFLGADETADGQGGGDEAAESAEKR
jgi:hypothetical protein